MPKIIILPLSLYVDNIQQRTQAAFRKLGIGWWQLLWQFMPLPSFLERFRGPSLPFIFDQYRRGEFSTTTFRQKVREKFPSLTITNKEFDSAWNEMQVMTDITQQALQEAQTLIDQGFKVYWIAGTNPLHFKDIQKKSHLDSLPGSQYLSFEKKKLGKDLFSFLLKDIRKKYKDVRPNDIAYFYTPPKDPYPQFGKFAWLNPFALIKNYEFYQAQRYVAKLKQEASSSNGFRLIPCQPKTDKSANILKKIQDLNWMDSVKKSKEHKSLPAITPQRKTQQIAKKTYLTHSHDLRKGKQRLNK